ncbi:MAG: class I SAM-dependent methyltransferase [Candidatus Micrarchaeales archaeon]|jgi:ubiquinone/menaquinone biosynthesis C-methylase UbiE
MKPLSYSETIKTYDKIARSYAEKYNTRNYWGPQYDSFESLLKGPKILDVGCGGGRDSLHFMEKNYEVTGIDFSSGMLKEAKRRVPNVRFIKMNMLNLEFPDASFDGIWCCASLLHIKKADVPEVLYGFSRVLKDDGVLFISVKEGEGEIIKKRDDGNTLFFANYSQKEFLELIKGSGFEASITPYTGMDGTRWLYAICKKDDLPSRKRE